MDALTKIKDLQEKQEKARTASTRLSTQLETLEGEKESLEAELKGEFGITFEDVEGELERLAAEQQEVLADAEEKLSKINL